MIYKGYNKGQSFINPKDIEPKDFSLYLFGIFIRRVERNHRAYYNRVLKCIRLLNKDEKCIICGSNNTYINKNGIKMWYKFNDGYICSKCHSVTIWDEEHKISLAKLNKSKGHWIGSTNPSWKGGIYRSVNKLIRESIKMSVWRTEVFIKDNFTCQICKMRNGMGKQVILNAHHIIPFRQLLERYNILSVEEAIKCKELWNTENGKTLCISCHKDTDSYLSRSKKA